MARRPTQLMQRLRVSFQPPRASLYLTADRKVIDLVAYLAHANRAPRWRDAVRARHRRRGGI